MNPREEYSPEVFWNMNRLRHTHPNPADKRRQDEQQASRERIAEADVPSKRTRLDPQKNVTQIYHLTHDLEIISAVYSL